MAVVEEQNNPSSDAALAASSNSMEDILTTIRNVIAGEEGSQPLEEINPEEVLELTEIVKEGKPPEEIASVAPEPQEAPQPEPSAPFEEMATPTEQMVATPPPAPAAQPAPQISAQEAALNSSNLLSEATVKLSSDTLKTFASLITSHNNGVKFRSGLTLEDIVMEALKPQLSQWLDKHLPQMVSRIVEREIIKLLPNDE